MHDHERLQRLASFLRERASMGQWAALRRMDPTAPGKAGTVLYTLLDQVEVDLDQPRSVRHWALILHALALARGLHHADIPLGKALHGIAFSDARLAQLLSADLDSLTDLLPRIARRLASQSQPADWRPLARLVLHLDTPLADQTRQQIARSFVLHAPKDAA